MKPGKLVVMDTETGKWFKCVTAWAAQIDLPYDAATAAHLLRRTNGMCVFKEMDPDHSRFRKKFRPGQFSKTGLWVQE